MPLRPASAHGWLPRRSRATPPWRRGAAEALRPRSPRPLELRGLASIAAGRKNGWDGPEKRGV
eukprot:9090612-Alexandrium_andersonii.AAC.1